MVCQPFPQCLVSYCETCEQCIRMYVAVNGLKHLKNVIECSWTQYFACAVEELAAQLSRIEPALGFSRCKRDQGFIALTGFRFNGNHGRELRVLPDTIIRFHGDFRNQFMHGRVRKYLVGESRNIDGPVHQSCGDAIVQAELAFQRCFRHDVDKRFESKLGHARPHCPDRRAVDLLIQV